MKINLNIIDSDNLSQTNMGSTLYFSVLCYKTIWVQPWKYVIIGPNATPTSISRAQNQVWTWNPKDSCCDSPNNLRDTSLSPPLSFSPYLRLSPSLRLQPQYKPSSVLKVFVFLISFSFYSTLTFNLL